MFKILVDIWIKSLEFNQILALDVIVKTQMYVDKVIWKCFSDRQ